MASTSGIVIIALIVGVIVLGGLWAWSRRAVTTDKPPAKLGDKPTTKPTPLVSSAPTIAPEPVAKPKPAPSPKPAPKAKAPAAKTVAPKPAAKKTAAPKIVTPKPPAAKPAPSKKATPKKAAAKPASPKAAPALTAIGIPAAVGKPDNLLQIKGVGPKLNTLLIGLGITRFDQIGAWTATDTGKVDEHLGTFKGRVERDSWIEQAGLLARGSIAEFEAKFGKLDSENK